MAIALYHNSDTLITHTLITRGFHVVNVTRHDRTRRLLHYEDWCLKHLQGEFAVRIHNSGLRLAGYFQLESDALLFRLKWS